MLSSVLFGAFSLAAFFSNAVAVNFDHHRRNNTITLSQCEIVGLTWAQGVPPYNATVLDGQQVIDSLTSSTDSLAYVVTAGAGSQISFVVTDSTGTTSAGGPFPVVAGGDRSCLKGHHTPTSPTPSPSPAFPTSSSSTSSPLSSQGDPDSPSSTPPSSTPPSSTSSPLPRVTPVPQRPHQQLPPPAIKRLTLLPKSFPARRIPDRSRSPWSSRYHQVAGRGDNKAY